VDATFAGRRPRERYHRTGAEQSQILTNYDVVPWAAPGATCPQKGGGLSAPPALGPFCLDTRDHEDALPGTMVWLTGWGIVPTRLGTLVMQVIFSSCGLSLPQGWGRYFYAPGRRI
jgi:hypothetical protein